MLGVTPLYFNATILSCSAWVVSNIFCMPSWVIGCYSHFQDYNSQFYHAPHGSCHCDMLMFGYYSHIIHFILQFYHALHGLSVVSCFRPRTLWVIGCNYSPFHDFNFIMFSMYWFFKSFLSLGITPTFHTSILSCSAWVVCCVSRYMLFWYIGC